MELTAFLTKISGSQFKKIHIHIFISFFFLHNTEL